MEGMKQNNGHRVSAPQSRVPLGCVHPCSPPGHLLPLGSYLPLAPGEAQEPRGELLEDWAGEPGPTLSLDPRNGWLRSGLGWEVANPGRNMLGAGKPLPL